MQAVQCGLTGGWGDLIINRDCDVGQVGPPHQSGVTNHCQQCHQPRHLLSCLLTSQHIGPRIVICVRGVDCVTTGVQLIITTSEDDTNTSPTLRPVTLPPPIRGQ